MRNHSDGSLSNERDNIATGLLCSVLLLLWYIVRMPILVVLAFIEPLVRVLLGGVAVLSLLAGLVYKGSSVPPPIPF